MKQKQDNFITITDDGTKKTSELLADLKALFPIWSYYSDEQLDRDFPPVKTSRQFMNSQEPDEDTANQSAEDLAKTGKEYITLRERLIFEALWFEKHKTHLDEKYITLCSGSRGRGGGVPYVYWDSEYGGLYVYWYYPQTACAHLRSRATQFPLSSSLSHLYPSDLEKRVYAIESWIISFPKP